MSRVIAAVLFAFALTVVGLAQTPQPFPRPGAPQTTQAPAPAVPVAPSAQGQTPPAAPAARAAAADPATPTAETLGISPYPTAQFIDSYDAGRGQRYYVFGTTAAFAEVVGYYRTQLDDRGNLVYREPPTHMFSEGRLGRYREETMAFPPSVTVKDWTSSGGLGYPNPKRGSQPARYPTTIMIVPSPTQAASR